MTVNVLLSAEVL